MAESISLIVVCKGSENVEADGHIISIGNGANTTTVRSLASEKLGLAIPLDDIILETASGDVLTEIEKVRLQQVVYINFIEKIKDTIPGPRRLPMVGNLYDMMPDLTAGWATQFEKYGSLVNVSILSTELVGTNDPAIAELFVKESQYFTKKIGNTLKEIKDFAGNGLFTSDTAQDEWQLAHKLLMPAFSPRAIKAYQPEMGKIAQETMKVLAEYKPTDEVEILNWCTNLTFETIGRIGFGYSFDLMHIDNPTHPFIEAMAFALSNSVIRFSRPTFFKKLPLERNRRWEEGNELMRSIVDTVIQERKKGEHAKDMEKDLLGFMLNARDEHNLGLSDENIRDQVITFLIAGHDTTANTLAYTLYELSRHPDIENKVLQEIANAGITSDKLPTVEQISSLKYLSRVLKETLRLHSPLRNISKFCQKDCVVPGGYRIKAGTACIVSVTNMHLNPQVYPDPHRFDPERFTPEEEQKRTIYSWLPFSTGPRACIGAQFALQEAKTVLSMFLHKFKFCYDGPPVQYDPYQATTKPLNMMMTIHPRTDIPEASENIVLEKKAAQNVDDHISIPTLAPNADSVGSIKLPKATFLFGTQTGTAQDYANQLASQAKRFGFKDITLCAMDRWEVIQSGQYEKSKDNANELIVICTATYNGLPPDSAENFNKFLDAKYQDGKDDALSGIKFAVFGLGNKNWRTYQSFPRKVDTIFDKLGADRFFTQGAGNADVDMDSDFNEWCAHFWTHTLYSFGATASESNPVIPTAASGKSSQQSVVKVQFIQPSNKEAWESGVNKRNGEARAILHTNRELQSEGSPRSTRHVEVDISQLSPVGDKGHLYNAGDHLEVYPENDKAIVEAIALNFGWILDSVFEIEQETLSDVSPRSLAKNIIGSCSIRNMLTYYADVSSAPSRAVLACFAAQLKLVAPKTAIAFEKVIIPNTTNEDEYPEFIKKHRTLLDLQHAYPQVNCLDLGQFLASVPIIQPRRYSIASSPLAHPTSAHLTVGIVDDVMDGKHYSGLASSFLKRSSDGLTMHGHLKSSKSTFSLPTDPSIPLILISAGTGFSPFRGFLQERQARLEQGQKVGETVLFFGCRRSDEDFIYQDELENYSKHVLTRLYTAFSRNTEQLPLKYVQHQLLANASEIWNMIYPSDPNVKPAAIYICGSGAMSRDVRCAFSRMFVSYGMASDDEEAKKYIDQLIEEKRYLCDVWG